MELTFLVSMGERPKKTVLIERDVPFLDKDIPDPVSPLSGEGEASRSHLSQNCQRDFQTRFNLNFSIPSLCVILL